MLVCVYSKKIKFLNCCYLCGKRFSDIYLLSNVAGGRLVIMIDSHRISDL